MLSLIFGLILAGTRALYEDPVADRLIREAVDSSYALRLDQAWTAARALQSGFPDHPAGYTIMAETYWWEAEGDPHNESIENAYYRAQELAVEKAESALEAGKYPKVELLAYLASAHGSYSRFQVTQKEAYFSALRAGLRAHRYADQVYGLDKNYYYIYVGLGAFNFFTGSLPAVIKPFAFLIGARGNREMGLQQLHIAMDRARYSRTEARIVYYTAMLEDKQYSVAFPVLDKLMADYPDNFVFYVWATDWFRRQKKNLEGAEYFERIHARHLSRSPLMAKYALLEKAGLQLAHSRNADALGVGAEMTASGQAISTFAADDMAFAARNLARRNAADVRADFHNLAHKLVPDDERYGNGLPRPIVPLIDVQIRATDAGGLDTNQHVTDSDGWFGNLLQAEAGPADRLY